ncbi:MAG: EutN/CcmL family microcompartment protein [Firmicutes bacterium]|nr:EutN/CcmL family microcompartment protein [Bacillota bacterium]
MMIGRVIGNVVSTCKDQHLGGKKLLVVDVTDEDGKRKSVIAVDAVGAGVGDRVLVLVEGGSARQALDEPKAPVNTAIVGIIDSLTVHT